MNAYIPAITIAIAMLTPLLAFSLAVRAVRTAKSSAERRAVLRMFELLIPSISIRGVLNRVHRPKLENRKDELSQPDASFSGKSPEPPEPNQRRTSIHQP